MQRYNCINCPSWQKEAQHFSPLSSLCQAYTPHQRRKHNLADPFRDKLPWNKWASQLLRILRKSKQWNILGVSTLYAGFPTYHGHSLELPDITPSTGATSQALAVSISSSYCSKHQKTHKHIKQSKILKSIHTVIFNNFTAVKRGMGEA